MSYFFAHFLEIWFYSHLVHTFCPMCHTAVRLQTWPGLFTYTTSSSALLSPLVWPIPFLPHLICSDTASDLCPAGSRVLSDWETLISESRGGREQTHTVFEYSENQTFRDRFWLYFDYFCTCFLCMHAVRVCSYPHTSSVYMCQVTGGECVISRLKGV